MDPGSDAALDLLWAFDGQSWKPPMDVNKARSMAATAMTLPCAVSHLDDPTYRPTPAAAIRRDEIRGIIDNLGFKQNKRDDRILSSQLSRMKLQMSTPKGSRLHAFIYTDQKLTMDACKKSTTADRGRCAYANEARSRAARTRGGIDIGIGVNEGVDTLCARLMRATTGRSVASLTFFDHGWTDFQRIGADAITPDTELPRQIASKFISSATITLYGCHTMADGVMQLTKQAMLADHLGHGLLLRGGQVVGFKNVVKLDVDRMRVIEPPPSERVVFHYPGCDGERAVTEIVRFLKLLQGRYKVAAGHAPAPVPASEVRVAVVVDDGTAYPAAHPDSAYYPWESSTSASET